MKNFYLFVRVFAPMINLGMNLINLFIWRDKRIVLMGAWMGNKYADNTRFLFEFLNKNKKIYGLRKVVWVTRNIDTLNMLKKMGYEAYLMHSLKSFYYHFKAGINIVCNINFPVKGYDGDIMGQLSGHSIKINTWHGIPLKAGKSTGENIKNEGIIGTIKYVLRKNRLFISLFTPGHWDKAYYLSTGKEASRRCSVFCGIDFNHFIESGYPRDCKSDLLLDNEKKVIEHMKDYKSIILYVPTFRENSDVPHPLFDKSLCDYISNENVLWIEKPHTATKKDSRNTRSNHNILFLDSKFDINVLLPYINLVITDYSSVCYDAMAFDKAVLYYAPDIENYTKNERGFLCNYWEMVDGYLSVNTDELKEQINLFLHDKAFNRSFNEQITKVKKEVLDKQPQSCKEIISVIGKTTGIFVS